MPNTVAQHAVATFTSPVNGTTPIDANSVRGNDNTLRSSYNNHDADPGVHLQSSALASRPAAGTAGRKWMTTDASSYRVWYDDGTNWQELTYLSGGGGTISGNLLITGTLGVTGLITATGGVSGNVTGNLTGNASTATTLQTARNINGVSFNGSADITVTAAAGTLTGSTLASGVTASSLTSVGTLTSLAISGGLTVDTDTLIVDAVNNRVGVGVSPLARLSVVSDNGSLGLNYGTSASPQRGNVWYDTDGSGWHMSIGKVQGGAFTEQVRIGDNGFVSITTGNLGLNTTNPAARLDVVGIFNGLQARFGNTAGRGLYVSTALNGGTNEGSTVLDARGASSGQFLFQTDSVTRATLDAFGNLGLGVTPSAWATGCTAFQFDSYSALFESVVGKTSLAFNARESATNSYVYLQPEAATMYQQVSGVHSWHTAASGTAGNAISFTQAMTLDASGNLLVGLTTAAARLDVLSVGTDLTLRARSANNDEIMRVESTGTAASLLRFINTGNNAVYAGSSSGAFVVRTTSTDRLQVKINGQTRFVPLSADPAGAETGDVYYNSSTNKLRVYNGAWVDLH